MTQILLSHHITFSCSFFSFFLNCKILNICTPPCITRIEFCINVPGFISVEYLNLCLLFYLVTKIPVIIHWEAEELFIVYIIYNRYINNINYLLISYINIIILIIIHLYQTLNFDDWQREGMCYTDFFMGMRLQRCQHIQFSHGISGFWQYCFLFFLSAC